MDWKKLWPTLLPILGALLTIVLPSIQHAVSSFISADLVSHPAVATLIASVICALYHALPSPVQK